VLGPGIGLAKNQWQNPDSSADHAGGIIVWLDDQSCPSVWRGTSGGKTSPVPSCWPGASTMLAEGRAASFEWLLRSALAGLRGPARQAISGLDPEASFCFAAAAVQSSGPDSGASIARAHPLAIIWYRSLPPA